MQKTPPRPRTWKADCQKIIRLAEEAICDTWGIGWLWRFSKKEWRGLKEGRVFAVVIALACLGGGIWIGARFFSSHPQLVPPSVQAFPYRQYDEREWPPLTDFQIAEWVRVLGPLHPKSIRIFWGQEVEARRLFRSIQDVGKQINCEVTANGGYADKPEITVHTRWKNNPVGPALVTLFTEYQRGGPSVPVVLEHPDEEGPESDATYKLGASVFVPECPRRETPNPERKTSDRRKEIKRLAEFLESGQKLEERFGENVIPSQQELQDWGQTVLDYVNSSEALGEGYAARFNRAGSQPGLEGIGLDGHTMEESERWKLLRKRNAVLLEFIKELER